MSDKLQHVFIGESDFEACHMAEEWCEKNGISVGRMERQKPRGLMWGDYDIQKWRNLRVSDLAELHGRMTGDMRKGPVYIEISRREKGGSK